MATSRFHNILRERVLQTISAYSDSIIGGQAKDFADYRDACGYIRGLYDALKICEDIEGDLEK